VIDVALKFLRDALGEFLRQRLEPAPKENSVELTSAVAQAAPNRSSWIRGRANTGRNMSAQIDIRFVEVARVELVHEYFSTALNFGIRIEPTPECAAALASDGLLLRREQNGLRVFRTELSRISRSLATLTLVFDLIADDRHVLAVTAFPVRDLILSPEGIEAIPLLRRSGRFIGRLELSVTPETSPTTRRVTLEAPAVQWTYQIRLKGGTPSTHFRVVDNRENNGMSDLESALTFAPPVIDTDAQTMTFRSGQLEHGGRFEPVLIPMRERARRFIQLVRTNADGAPQQVLVEHLPNPGLRASGAAMHVLV